MSPQAAELSPAAARYALIAIVLVAVALRVPTLGVQSLWFDESATWFQVSGTPGELLYRTANDNYPPLYNILTWLAVQVLGDAEWVLRLPAALLAIANVPLLHLLGRRIATPSAGLLAAALLALSAYHVWYSQEARMYSLLACTATAYGWAAFRALERSGPRPAVLLALTGALLVYSHPYGPLTWAGIGLGALLVLGWRRDWPGLGWLAGAGIATILAFLPWALILIGRAEFIESTGFWIDPPTPLSALEDLIGLTGGIAGLVLIAIPLLFWRRGRLVPLRLGFAPVILVAWIAVPVLLGVAASLLFEPVFLARYLLGTLPAWLLLYSTLLVALLSSVRARALAATVSLLASLIVLLVAAPGARTDWRALAAEAQSRYRPGDCVMLDFDYHRVSLDYYWRDPARCTIPGDASPERVVAEAPAGRLFLVATTDNEEWETLVAALGTVADQQDAIDFRDITLFIFTSKVDGASFSPVEQ